MKGKYHTLTVPNNAGLYEVFGLSTAQDVSDWSVVGYVFSLADPATVLAPISTTIDADAKTIIASMDAAVVAPLLPAGESSVEFGYTVLVRPNLSFGLRFFYGTLTVKRGGPAWI